MDEHEGGHVLVDTQRRVGRPPLSEDCAVLAEYSFEDPTGSADASLVFDSVQVEPTHRHTIFLMTVIYFHAGVVAPTWSIVNR
jgi:hypothetical protein